MYRILAIFGGAIFAAALTPIVIEWIAPKMNGDWVAGSAIGVFAFSLLLGFGLTSTSIVHVFFGTQVRGVLTSSILGALIGVGLVWFFDQSGLLKEPDQLKFAYIFMAAVFSGVGILISLIPDYSQKKAES